MEKNKVRGNTTDESAVVKAAAWAWYQHGSGSDGNPTREYDVKVRSRHVPRPSRYRQESAMIKAKLGVNVHLDHHDSSKPTVGSLSLLDAYEIRSISQQLDSLIQCSRADHRECNNDEEAFSDNYITISSSSGRSSREVIRKTKFTNLKKLMRGFWLRNAVAVCSTREDQVVDMRRRSGFQQRPPRPVSRLIPATNRL
ncbi:uncharacterized protein LOC133816368 [Humulus lupulus]|uniref:uncharacterized protein LOC133816368 n=1 Tax=Humulus lupulus TaxID=3486 RepID=UPI002B411786|nr:uncharacterized protein LOC133816368 [Humulus lupulus]